MRNKKLILGLIAFVVVIAALIGVYTITRPETSEGSKEFTVEVVHGDGSAKTFTYQTDSEYLGEVLLSEGLVVGEMGDYGLYILTVDGEDAVYETDGAYWSLLQNGEYAMQGADMTPVADGDEFSLVYTIG